MGTVTEIKYSLVVGFTLSVERQFIIKRFCLRHFINSKPHAEGSVRSGITVWEQHNIHQMYNTYCTTSFNFCPYFTYFPCFVFVVSRTAMRTPFSMTLTSSPHHKHTHTHALSLTCSFRLVSFLFRVKNLLANGSLFSTHQYLCGNVFFYLSYL